MPGAIDNAVADVQRPPLARSALRLLRRLRLPRAGRLGSQLLRSAELEAKDSEVGDYLEPSGNSLWGHIPADTATCVLVILVHQCAPAPPVAQYLQGLAVFPRDASSSSIRTEKRPLPHSRQP